MNGIDSEEWNPATDPHIAAHYTAENLAGKKECRRDLLHAYGFEEFSDDTAIIGVVSRFATQKGSTSSSTSWIGWSNEDMVLVMLGSGEEYYERLLGRDGAVAILTRCACR